MQKDRCSMQLTNLLRSLVLFSNLRVHNVESLSMSELKNLEDSKSCKKCLWFGLEHCLGTDALNVIRTRLRWAANISTFQSKNIMANGMQIATMLRNFQHHEELLLANGNICEAKLTESWFVALLVLLCITRWQKKKINKNVKQQNRKKTQQKPPWITEYQKNPQKLRKQQDDEYMNHFPLLNLATSKLQFFWVRNPKWSLQPDIWISFYSVGL